MIKNILRPDDEFLDYNLNMKYYEMHEIVYRKLKEDGVLSWDKSKTFDEMWTHSTNIFLEKFLSKIGCSFSGLQVLDLGTGTGTSALFAAKNGAQSVGVEISASAIEIAKENAIKLGLSAELIQGDVLALNLDRKFDVVIDSTILHCLVGLKDRRSFYNSVKLHMKSDSYFFVNTMIASSDMSSRFPKEYFLYQDEVLWSLGINEVSERKIIDGKSFFPHRTLLSEAKQLDEFNENGFEVMMIERVTDLDGSFDLVALLKVRE
jgi:2-polyprenyl-3-methyl-5-hydroxy-6-metoxy-1,4-benzoquinol methylase